MNVYSGSNPCRLYESRTVGECAFADQYFSLLLLELSVSQTFAVRDPFH